MDIKWKDIPGYEGFYQVNNLGIVKRLPTQFNCGSRWGKLRSISFKERILTISLTSNGYPMVVLSKKGEKKQIMVHRLVAMCFLDFKRSLIVNHKDGNKKNNAVSNLEMCTYRENSLHSYHVLGNKKVNRKAVIDISTGIIYPSIKNLISKNITKYKYSTISRKLTGSLVNDTNFKIYDIQN